MKEYKEINEKTLAELGKHFDLKDFNETYYNIYQGLMYDIGYRMVLCHEEEDCGLTMFVEKLDGTKREEYMSGYYIHEICDKLTEVYHWYSTKALAEQNHFASVSALLTYIGDEGYLCGGDRIEFIGNPDDDSEIVEVNVFSENGSILANYKIIH